LVDAVGDAVAVEDLDDEGDEGEGGDDAAWVDGGVVGRVVEDAAEDVVVCEFEEGAGWGVVLGGGTLSWERERGAYGAAYIRQVLMINLIRFS
jgi:hypothetical protein